MIAFKNSENIKSIAIGLGFQLLDRNSAQQTQAPVVFPVVGVVHIGTTAQHAHNFRNPINHPFTHLQEQRSQFHSTLKSLINILIQTFLQQPQLKKNALKHTQ